MPRKYDYRRRLPHIQKDNRPIFLTFTTCRRWKLPDTARDIVLDCCLAQNSRKLDLHASVVMPDHVHLILTPLRRQDGWTYSLPEIMHAIKGAAASRINRTLERSGPVWQEEFFDHVLRSNESLGEKVNYVCQNPVRAGLVRNETEYRWLWRGEIPVI
jgi:REP element-mobilizing transposase RayT